MDENRSKATILLVEWSTHINEGPPRATLTLQQAYHAQYPKDIIG